jgi:transketolase
VTDYRTQAWLDQVDANITAIVRRYGWYIEYVGGGGCDRPGCDGGADDDGPPFAYTVGLFGLHHPELLIFGVPPGTAAGVLNDLGERVRSGTTLLPGQLIEFDTWPHRIIPEDVPNPGEIVSRRTGTTSGRTSTPCRPTAQLRRHRRPIPVGRRLRGSGDAAATGHVPRLTRTRGPRCPTIAASWYAGLAAGRECTCPAPQHDVECDDRRIGGSTMTAIPFTSETNLEALAQLAAQLRVDSIRSSTSAGSGHPTSSMSAADLLAVLIARHLRYDWDDPSSPANDHMIFSKGHASPLLYAVFKAVGVVSEHELMTGYRRFGERLQGHPTPVLPWVDVATGSLGQGLPDAVGIALAGKYLERRSYRVWVLCGDSELTEGSIWEALDKASYYRLSNLIAIVDVNRLGQRGPTELGWDLNAYARRAEAFGARVLMVDGHDLAAIDRVLTTAEDPDGQPTVVLAKTIKGRGFAEVEDSPDWHGKPFPDDMAARAIAELDGIHDLVLRGPRPSPAPDADAAAPAATPEAKRPQYAVGDAVATRKAYGDALVALGARDPQVVALDGEVSNSTYANEFAHTYPDRYFEMFIAEQQLVAAATGLAVRGYRPFASTFAAFLTRAYDFIRMGAISGVDVRLIGSHAGVEIGADGPSQMGLEDLAMFRVVHGATVLYPSDATSTVALVDAMATTPGISYLRTTRGAYPVLYPDGEAFPVGGSKLLRSGDHDDVTLIGAGVTLHACLHAADLLLRQGLQARVIDCYSVKPIDTAALTAAAAATAGRIVVAEDHHPEGGLGAAVSDALLAAGASNLRIARLAVRGMPGSGSGAELLAWAGIDADHIAAAARQLVSAR